MISHVNTSDHKYALELTFHWYAYQPHGCQVDPVDKIHAVSTISPAKRNSILSAHEAITRPKHVVMIQHADASTQLEIDKLQKILPQCQAIQLQVLMTFLPSTQDHPQLPVLYMVN